MVNKKGKQPDEISKYGRLPGSTHTQMEFPIDEVIFDPVQLHTSYVKSSIQEVDKMKDKDILCKYKKKWNNGCLMSAKPGIVKFPDPPMKASNSRFTSIPKYEFNYRSEYIPKSNGPIASKPDRRRFGVTDERDDSRVIIDGKYEPGWKDDNGEIRYDCVEPTARKAGQAPVKAFKTGEGWDKPVWNISTSTECLEDQIEREKIYERFQKGSEKSLAKKNAKITTTRMGLIHRHNAVAAAIREKKTMEREKPKGEDPLPPTIAAIRRSERQTRKYAHSGAWEMNKTEGRMMWSDTGSFDYDSKGDQVKVVTNGAWTFAAPL